MVNLPEIIYLDSPVSQTIEEWNQSTKFSKIYHDNYHYQH